MEIGTKFVEDGVEYVMGSCGIKISAEKIEEAKKLNENYIRYVKQNYGEVNINGN